MRMLTWRVVLVFAAAAIWIEAICADVCHAVETEVVLVSTVHEPTANFSRAALDEILTSLHPDVLLLELDSSFFDHSHELREEFQRITLETSAAVALRKATGVQLRPYDIEGRNQFFERHNYFAREHQLYQKLDRLSKDGKLSPEARATFDALSALGRLRDAFQADGPEVINSAACDEAMRLKHRWAFQGLGQIVDQTPELSEFKDFVRVSADFWRQRNDAMVANILKYASEFSGKRIVVLCGLEHRCVLATKLAEQATTSGVTVRSFSTKSAR